MFKRKPTTPVEKTELDKVIDDAEKTLLGALDAGSEDHARAVDQLVKLYEIKKSSKPSRSVSPDTVALIAGNILVTAMVVGHERANVVTSKALSFLAKAK